MKIFKRTKNNKGQSIVEMALLLPILLMILLGILEFGRIYGAYIVISNAARDAARVGSVGGTTGQIQDSVTNNTGSLNEEDLAVVISRTGTGNRGDAITVTVEYDIVIMAPFLGIVVDNPMHLDAAMTMRIE